MTFNPPPSPSPAHARGSRLSELSMKQLLVCLRTLYGPSGNLATIPIPVPDQVSSEDVTRAALCVISHLRHLLMGRASANGMGSNDPWLIALFVDEILLYG